MSTPSNATREQLLAAYPKSEITRCAYYEHTLTKEEQHEMSLKRKALRLRRISEAHKAKAVAKICATPLPLRSETESILFERKLALEARLAKMQPKQRKNFLKRKAKKDAAKGHTSSRPEGEG